MKLQVSQFINTFLLLTSLSALIACTPSQADTNQTEVANMLSALKFSDQMYERGKLQQEPVTMAFAAELRAQALGTWNIKGDKDGGILSPTEMLDNSFLLARNDKLATAMINRIRGRRTRGGIQGPKIEHTKVSANQPFRAEVIFEPNMPAVIYVESEKEGLVDILVTAKDHVVMCNNTKPVRRKICHWKNGGQHEYSIVVTTTSPSPVEILVIIN